MLIEPTKDSLFCRYLRTRVLSIALMLCVSGSWAGELSYGKEQIESYKELIENLENRHYEKFRYDSKLSLEHLERYLMTLDQAKMYFTKSYIDQSITALKNDLSTPYYDRLSQSMNIFSHYKSLVKNRIDDLLAEMPSYIQNLDFSIEEYLEIDLDKRSWAMSETELDRRWEKSIKNQVLSLMLSGKSQNDIIDLLKQRYQRQQTTIDQYNSTDIFGLYANSIAELYDPHTRYMSPRSSENFNINMSLSLEGIGALLTTEEEYTKVQRLISAGPADKQGELKPSDKIVGVAQGNDGEMQDIVGWRIGDVVDLIRGPKGTIVRLEVIPANKNSDSRKTISISRNEVKLEEQAAKSSILNIKSSDQEIKIGVIKLPTFYIDFQGLRMGDPNYRSTTRDVELLLSSLQKEHIDGLVIDLRDNGGGSLQEANELTGLFIEYGPTVQIQHSSKKIWPDGKRVRTPFYDGPLVVMINRLSASASEIFAGAIQDYGRGIIVGDRSFGKGTVQTLVPLKVGQLKITESKFYRVSGASTQNHGVVPDIFFPSFYDHEEIGESALNNALKWDQIPPIRHARYNDFSDLLPQIKLRFSARANLNPEFLLLKEQVAFAEEARSIKYLSLNLDDRSNTKLERDQKALEIENRRREIQGLELLDNLNDSEESAGSDVTDQQADVLLFEAANILGDSIILPKLTSGNYQQPQI